MTCTISILIVTGNDLLCSGKRTAIVRHLKLNYIYNIGGFNHKIDSSISHLFLLFHVESTNVEQVLQYKTKMLFKNKSFFFLCTVRRMSNQLLKTENTILYISGWKVHFQLLYCILGLVLIFFQHYRKNQFEQRLFHLTIGKSKHITILNDILYCEIARLIKKQFWISSIDIRRLNIVHINERTIQFLYVTFEFGQYLRQHLGGAACYPERLQAQFVQGA